MTDTSHNLYVTQGFKLGTVTFPGFTSIEYTKRKTQVVPKGDAKLRRQKAYTTGIEETLSIECEDPGVPLPVGPVAMEAKQVRAAEAETYGDVLTIATAVGATVDVVEGSVSINSEASNRIRFQLAVNSADGLVSGLSWTGGSYPAAPAG